MRKKYTWPAALILAILTVVPPLFGRGLQEQQGAAKERAAAQDSTAGENSKTAASSACPLDGELKNPQALETLISRRCQSYLLLDVRTEREYASGHIPTAELLPVQQIPATLPPVPKDQLIILYCRSGNRSSTAEQLLRKEGFTRIVDFGGVHRWPGELIRVE